MMMSKDDQDSSRQKPKPLDELISDLEEGLAGTGSLDASALSQRFIEYFEDRATGIDAEKRKIAKSCIQQSSDFFFHLVSSIFLFASQQPTDQQTQFKKKAFLTLTTYLYNLDLTRSLDDLSAGLGLVFKGELTFEELQKIIGLEDGSAHLHLFLTFYSNSNSFRTFVQTARSIPPDSHPRPWGFLVYKMLLKSFPEKKSATPVAEIDAKSAGLNNLLEFAFPGDISLQDKMQALEKITLERFNYVNAAWIVQPREGNTRVTELRKETLVRNVLQALFDAPKSEPARAIHKLGDELNTKVDLSLSEYVSIDEVLAFFNTASDSNAVPYLKLKAKVDFFERAAPFVSSILTELSRAKAEIERSEPNALRRNEATSKKIAAYEQLIVGVKTCFQTALEDAYENGERWLANSENQTQAYRTLLGSLGGQLSGAIVSEDFTNFRNGSARVRSVVASCASAASRRLPSAPATAQRSRNPLVHVGLTSEWAKSVQKRATVARSAISLEQLRDSVAAELGSLNSRSSSPSVTL